MIPFAPAALAKLRWFINGIENRALERYAENRENWNHIADILTVAYNDLERLRRVLPANSNECEPPWVWCNDECVPECPDANNSKLLQRPHPR